MDNIYNNKRAKFLIPANRALCAQINENLLHIDMLRAAEKRPRPILLHLDKGEGRTSILDYVAKSYTITNLIRFSGGTALFVEAGVGDGSADDVRQVFEELNAAAKYASSYYGVIGIDINGLVTQIGTDQYTSFLENIKPYCRSAAVIFFLPSEHTKQTLKLEEKLCNEIENLYSIPFEPLKLSDLAGAVLVRLKEAGAVVKDSGSSDITLALREAVKKKGLTTMKEAVSFAEDMLMYADYDNKEHRPIITVQSVRACFGNVPDNERSVRK